MTELPIKLTAIRPEILRNYYVNMYGDSGSREMAYNGATFEEYFAILRISYSGVSRHKAASTSRNPAFKALAAEFAQEAGSPDTLTQHPDVAKVPKKYARFEKLPKVDLREAGLTTELDILSLTRIKNVSGHENIRNLKHLQVIQAILCDTTETVPPGPLINLNRLDLNDCSEKFVENILRIAVSKWVRIVASNSPSFDLAQLKNCRDMQALYLTCGMTVGISNLSGLPLEILWLTNVPVNAAFTKTLASLDNTLRELRVENTFPFGPEALPLLPKLERLWVAAYPEFQDAWIEFALSHPEIMCDFMAFQRLSIPMSSAQILEVYRGVDILEKLKGKKTWYAVYGDLASLLKGHEISNNDLKDNLEKFASKCKPKVELDSEGDELRMESSSLASIKKCLDEIVSAT